MRRKRSSEGCELDMTPMIDVVFQMIIFFIVTLKMDQKKNEEIKLADAADSPAYKPNPKMMVIEVDRRGWLSLGSYQVTAGKLKSMIQHRYNKYGMFPVMIRADKNTKHRDVRKVMDICTAVGIWKIDFAAIKEHKK